MLFAHGSLLLLRTPLIALLPQSNSNHVYGSAWLTAHSFTRCCSPSRLHSSCWPWRKSATSCATVPPPCSIRSLALPTVASFMQDAAQFAKRHRAKPRPMAVLAIDLDHFKSINDRFGHAIGDRVLELFANAARQSVRSNDLVGRLGGDEFAVVLGDTSRDKAMAAADRIRTKFSAGRFRDQTDRPIGATISIGLVLCQEGRV